MRTYLCMIVLDRLETMRENLEKAIPYFDDVIVVDGGSTDGTLEWLQAHPDIHVVHFPWCDDFAASRSQYLAKIGELKERHEVSVYCRTDDDEFYSDAVLKNIPEIMQTALDAGYNQVKLRCRSITLNPEGGVVKESLDDFYKPLLHLWEAGMNYVHPVHESLHTPSGANQVCLNLEYLSNAEPCLYEHRKTQGQVWERALRNFFIGEGFHTSPANRRIWDNNSQCSYPLNHLFSPKTLSFRAQQYTKKKERKGRKN